MLKIGQPYPTKLHLGRKESPWKSNLLADLKAVSLRPISGKVIPKFRELGLRAFIGFVKLNIRAIAYSAADRLIDYRYGTETSQPIHSPQLRASGQNLRYGTSYILTPWWVFRRIVRNLGIYPPEYSFVDFGSGKGRVPRGPPSAQQLFGKSIDVDYVGELREASLRNGSRFPGAKVEFYCTDAPQISILHEPCVLERITPGPCFPTWRSGSIARLRSGPPGFQGAGLSGNQRGAASPGRGMRRLKNAMV